MSVQGLLKKAAGLEIRMICPLHSVIWREDLPWLIDKYLKWSSYTPEEKSVTIAYGSVFTVIRKKGCRYPCRKAC